MLWIGIGQPSISGSLCTHLEAKSSSSSRYLKMTKWDFGTCFGGVDFGHSVLSDGRLGWCSQEDGLFDCMKG